MKSRVINTFFALGLFFVAMLICGCGASRGQFHPEKKYSPDQLRQDFDIAWETYQKNHPAYDWYASADSINGVFQKVRATLNDSLTEPEFRLRLSYAVASIRCGHTTVSSSKAYARFINKAPLPQFPLVVKVWGTDSMVVIQNLLKDTARIKRGTIIKSIDSIPPSVFIRQMKNYVSTDGFSEGFKELQVSANFSARFRWMYGLNESYKIHHINDTGALTNTVLPLYIPGKKDSLAKKDNSSKMVNGTNQKKPGYGSFRLDTSKGLAILELNNFSHNKIPGLIRKSFRTIEQEKIKNLVIDLRLNGGGKIDNSTLLTKFIIDHPFKVADSVSAKDLKPAYWKHTQHGWVFKYFGWLMAKRQSDGRYHMRGPERTVYYPKKKNHFEGKVYALTSGFTFSASTLFLAKVMLQPNVTVIGEETGGGARGNSAVFTPFVTLPNTRVRTRLPMFRMITDVNIPDIGRGIIPDIEVLPDSKTIKAGKDKKLGKVFELIAEQKK